MCVKNQNEHVAHEQSMFYYMESVSAKWYLPTGHSSHFCFSVTGSDFVKEQTETSVISTNKDNNDNDNRLCVYANRLLNVCRL